jgi:hypothetical protein
MAQDTGVTLQMATQADVRRTALSFPGAKEAHGHFAFEVLNKGKLKGFVWVWMERLVPKKPRVPNPGVIAVRVASLTDKDLILAAEPTKYFTEPHYAGFPAVLVRLDAVTVADLKPLIADAWRCMAPRDLVEAPKTKRKTMGAKRTKTTASKSLRGRQGKA